VKIIIFISSEFLSDECNFFSWGESVRDTFNIKNQGDTSKNPFCGWEFGLELGCEHVGVSSIFCLVDWALINTLINLDRCWDLVGSAVYNWDN